MTLEFVWKQEARYQLGELSDIVVRFSESITCLTLSPTKLESHGPLGVRKIGSQIDVERSVGLANIDQLRKLTQMPCVAFGKQQLVRLIARDLDTVEQHSRLHFHLMRGAGKLNDFGRQEPSRSC